MGTKTWTSQADFLGATTIGGVDIFTTVNSIVLARGPLYDEFVGNNGDAPNTAWWDNTHGSWDTILSNTLNVPEGKNDYSNLKYKSTLTSLDFTIEYKWKATRHSPTAGYSDDLSIWFINRGGNAVRIINEIQDNRVRLYDDSTGQLGIWSSSLTDNTWYWFRIRCANTAGHIYFDSSTDGTTYTNRIDYTIVGTLTNYTNGPFFQFYGAVGALTVNQSLEYVKLLDGVSAPYPYTVNPQTINFQYDTGVTGTIYFTTYSFTATKPTNTNVRMRFRTAATQGGLSSALWTLYNAATADNINLPSSSRWVEVQAELSTTASASTPQVDDLTINWSTTSGGGSYRLGAGGYIAASGSKTWTSQADWTGWSSRDFAGKQVDYITTVGSLTLCLYAYLDNMEAGAVNALPSNSYTAGTSATYCYYDTAQKVSGNQSIKVVGNAGDNYFYIYPTTAANARTVEMQYYQAGAPNGNRIILLYLLNTSGSTVVALGVGTNGHYYYSDKNTTWTDSGVACTNTAWHRIKISYDSVGNTAKAWADSTYLAGWSSSIATKTIGGWEGCENQTTNQSMWFDDVKVWEAYVTADNVYPTTYANSPASINYQYDTGNTGTFYFTNYSMTATRPTNTNTRIRFKTAATQGGLATAVWTMYNTATADNINLPSSSRWIEVQIELSTADSSTTPQIDDLTINWATTAPEVLRIS